MHAACCPENPYESACSTQAGREKSGMKVEKIVVGADNYPSYFPMNCYLLHAEENSDSVMVVDPGGEYARILGAVGERSIGAFVLTHRHMDHCGALKDMQDVWESGSVPVYIHPLDGAALLKTIRGAGYVELANALEKVLKPLSDEDILIACGLRLRVLHTPGHSTGSLCLYDEMSQVLISGDTIFKGTTGRTDLEGGSPRQMHESLQKLAQLPDETIVYPGHEELTTIAFERTRSLVEY